MVKEANAGEKLLSGEEVAYGPSLERWKNHQVEMGGEGEFYQWAQHEAKAVRKGPVQRTGVWLECKVCK